MAMERPLATPDEDYGFAADPVEVEIVSDDDEGIVSFGDEEVQSEADHDSNLAEFMDERELDRIASDAIDGFEVDVRSRKEWAKAYIRGLDLMGMKIEDRAEPWPGASGVFHPILTESVVRFQAQAMGELFPAAGPVRAKIIGSMTNDIMDQAERVETEMNYLMTEVMPEYRDEMEMLLFRLALAGSAFKKVYYDPICDVPVAMFVPVEDFVVNYGASDLKRAQRYTHRMKKTKDELDALMFSGFYRDIDLPAPTAEWSDIQEKYNEMSGESPSLTDDDRHTILEVHMNLQPEGQFADPDGLSRPYVVTVEKSSRKVLAIRRNWYKDDQKKQKRLHFVHYRYLPGMGFYGMGLIHMLGGLTESATAILRQLIDAGTLANLPAGLKAKGLRIKGDNAPFYPGEFRDVDVGAGSIRDQITFLPYKEPSTVLHQLLMDITEEARRIGSVADIDIGNVSQQAPVGTTLALMERSMKVMSGVQARLHASLKNELRLIARVVFDYMPEEYSYNVSGEHSRREDFDGRVDVIPVSDPNAATMSQRIMQYQAALQLAQGAPQLYDMGKLHRQMLGVLGIQDASDIIKLPEDIKPMDPVTENMAILKQEPVKAFQYQDHEAHIRTHLAAAQDPKIMQLVGQSPFASAIQAAMASHVTEHVAFEYRRQIEKNLGVALPDPESPLPEDIEREVSRMAAEAADILLQKNVAEAQAQENAQKAQDPVIQMQMKELQLKERRLALDEKVEAQKLALERERNIMNIEVQKERIVAENKRKGADIGVRAAEVVANNQTRERLAEINMATKTAKDLASGRGVNVTGNRRD